MVFSEKRLTPLILRFFLGQNNLKMVFFLNPHLSDFGSEEQPCDMHTTLNTTYYINTILKIIDNANYTKGDSCSNGNTCHARTLKI